MDHDFDEDGNNIVPCPICLNIYCPSKEEREKCPEEEAFKQSIVEQEIADTLPKLRKQCKDIMDDPYRGLKETSNTNKTRHELLALVEDSYNSGQRNNTIKLNILLSKLKRIETRGIKAKMEWLGKPLERYTAISDEFFDALRDYLDPLTDN